MANVIEYGCTALNGTNKTGVLKPDADGRYDMILGALEYPNSVGDVYTLESARKLFEKGSALMRRIENGQLRAEYGHPKMVPGMSEADFVNRIMSIDENNVCAHISEVYIDTSTIKDPRTGNTIITFRGKVKPTGPKGPFLKEILDDPKQNCAFSVRSLTTNKRVGFHYRKDFQTIIGWDYVNEPGLSIANKYAVPTLESYDVQELAVKSFSTALEMTMKGKRQVSVESMQLLNEVVSSLTYINHLPYHNW